MRIRELEEALSDELFSRTQREADLSQLVADLKVMHLLLRCIQNHASPCRPKLRSVSTLFFVCTH